MKHIPVYQPSLDSAELDAVLDCVESTWISSKGKYIEKFELEFSKYLGIKYSNTVSNGTVALHLALLSIGIKPGDEVIVPTLTYVASVNAIKYCGAKPVFIDSEPDTWQMDHRKIVEKITSKTKAIMVVHLYGMACNMTEIMKISKQHRLHVVEDCAEAFGTKWKGVNVGNFGDIAAFSFFGNKTITTGEGGMVSTNKLRLHKLVYKLKGQGLAKNREYWHDIVGYNYRMTNICAAIGVEQLKKANQHISRKRQIAREVSKGLEGLPLTVLKESKHIFSTYWMISIATRTQKDRKELRNHLAKMGIETRPAFYPIHNLPMYKTNEKFPIAEKIGKTGINLPSWPGLSSEQVKYIINGIKMYYE